MVELRENQQLVKQTISVILQPRIQMHMEGLLANPLQVKPIILAIRKHNKKA